MSSTDDDTAASTTTTTTPDVSSIEEDLLIDELNQEGGHRSVLSKHLENIQIRGYDDIIKSVTEMPVDPAKIASFVVLVLRLLLNVGTISYNFGRMHSSSYKEPFTDQDDRDDIEDEDYDLNNMMVLMLYWVEFLSVVLIFASCVIAVINAKLSKAEDSGYTSYMLAKMVKFLSSFSLLIFIPSTAKGLVIFYRAQEFAMMGSDRQKKITSSVFCICAVPFAIFYCSLGLASFVIKLSAVSFMGIDPISVWIADTAKVFQALAFLNNIMSITDIWNVRYEAMLQFVFAGEDGMLSMREWVAQQAFLHELCDAMNKRFGYAMGFVHITQLYDIDIQKLVIDEKVDREEYLRQQIQSPAKNPTAMPAELVKDDGKSSKSSARAASSAKATSSGKTASKASAKSSAKSSAAAPASASGKSKNK